MSDPQTPKRALPNLSAAWTHRSRAPVNPIEFEHQSIRVPASAPATIGTERPQSMYVGSSAQRIAPTEPAAMRIPGGNTQIRQLEVLAPRRRVFPNIVADEEPRSPARIRPGRMPKPPLPPPPPPPPSPMPAPRPLPAPKPKLVTIKKAPQTEASKKAAEIAKLERYPGGRIINANIINWTNDGTTSIARTELVDYPKSQQKADYAALLADSTPEETWESRRGAPLIPAVGAWIDIAGWKNREQWKNGMKIAYNVNKETAAKLAGTSAQQAQEKAKVAAGHKAGGVSVALEIERNKFVNALARDARDMVLRDNGVMPRNALAKPAKHGEPKAWVELFAELADHE